MLRPVVTKEFDIATSATKRPVPDEQFSSEDVRAATLALTERFDRSYWLRCIEEQRQPEELMTALGEGGLLGIGVPVEYGGQGGGLTEQVALVEGLGRAGLPSYGFMIPNFVRSIVLKCGNPDQIKKFVPGTLDGRTGTCFALTEPDAGTNAFAMRTSAERSADGWRLNGQKVFISGAAESNQMVVVARTRPADEDPSRALSVFMLDLPSPGVTMTPLRISATAPERQYSVYFNDVLLPEDSLIGEAGRGGEYMFAGLNPERILAAAMALGLGWFVLEKGARYSRERAPFGAPIGSYQGVAHPLARAFVDLEAARLMTEEAARAFDDGRDAGLRSSGAKLLASEAAYAAHDAAVQAHGGYAFDADYDLTSLYEIIRLLRIAPINNESVLNYVARKALSLPVGR